MWSFEHQLIFFLLQNNVNERNADDVNIDPKPTLAGIWGINELIHQRKERRQDESVAVAPLS